MPMQQGIMHCLVTISTALLVWILCNFILYYLNRKKECFFNYVEKYGKEEKNAKNVSLVIAHPDDEVMFFLPTLNLLFRKKKKKEVFLLCLSNGNYYRQGIIRDKEIYDVWSYLGGEKKNCKVVDNPKIQDGWTPWNEELLVNILKDYCSKHNIRKVLTFDSYGISGHPNHRSIYKSARYAYFNSFDVLDATFA
ncbi:N-acetylglucosaminylphosphatidylinositol deacetylase, putative [Plasmodium ovale wallikeri]|uniref:N-acetylglucosaminylphosphatidylinositol deacetylase n=1 Tax=Plasmodium ovale wallikeri TaxID=864142 RepID=A0A1A8Z243_PLAOA|nr:N-acetylglucosaminylphosphatidylinositol deacetylase, putative [Plasmodium ovale wallikeri]SBT38640.1 N-acetylglucosaminylphosphatidylinositol deacetylase, putative [Plasmodium ovale wallikeri]